MDDFNALAAALGADLEGVRASLILSRDGLVIGAHPADAEAAATPSWSKIATLGDPERGFLQFATEVWCYVRRGPYAAFVVATVAVRPGLLIDQMERVLLAAEEGRSERPVRAEPAAAAAPSGKPRSTLHRDPSKDGEPIVLESAPVAAPAAPAAAAAAAAGATGATKGAGATEGAPASEAAEAASSASPAVPDRTSADATAEATEDPAERRRGKKAPAGPKPGASMWGTGSGDEDVDTFALAREFGGLLQDGEQGADG